MKIHSQLVLMALISLLASCNLRDCENKNRIFDQFPPNSNEYKNELVKQLSLVEKINLTFNLTNYMLVEGKEYLSFNVHGEDLCATLVLVVKESDDKIISVTEKKGVSYRGAEFVNLKFKIEQDSINTELIYAGFDRILD